MFLTSAGGRLVHLLRRLIVYHLCKNCVSSWN